MSTVKRLVEFHNYLKENGYGGRNVFEVNIGKKSGYLTTAYKNNASIGSEVLEKVSSLFPDLNLDWLITGKGNMLKSTQSNLSSNMEASEEESYIQLSKALEIIAKQQETISLLVKEIGLNQSSEENIEDQKKKRKIS